MNAYFKDKSFESYWKENGDKLIKLNISYGAAEKIFNHKNITYKQMLR